MMPIAAAQPPSEKVKEYHQKDGRYQDAGGLAAKAVFPNYIRMNSEYRFR